MKKIYSAGNLLEAQIVLDLLEHAYIPARIFNQHAQGCVGEIPFTHAYPEVWIIREEDFERGKRVVETYEKTPTATGIIRCPACNEENPANFQLCWKCGSGLEIILYQTKITE
ncbi:MAG: DUF2007 domain-containing protein [Nitrosomonas sp.]|uniref:putative signal transducing protein n=1 Tax=Nitrosomonas sp. TaxID=42353 RepID=UPI0025F2B60F|nr:DUF2007 domain-containing protein [Nitrosomonas sp.]MBY0474516.1 DUF2007 domain-containing protein [Nitrosomonas sp.]